MNSVIRMLFDAAGIGGEDEKEVIKGLIRDNEEYATDFICGLGFIGEKEREVLEAEYPNLFSLEIV
ncbi:MAG: hypothetical protein US30_C0010G0006 [Candidatus Moranbacteria bacterium GW2011_GWF2_36_839]|nr:MAG: hypothetical protein US27_C0010G0035 [Candidatus Moranbacteria bacterium GW2011_GWF1_36_78]KKQ16849.1 MAG: hypothetical protein US30_C0010G0006 [Candidatus Moranbacteria bacterium GW2011_GWF2_36_839]